MGNGAIVSQKEALKSFRGLLQRMKPQVAMALPAGMSSDRMIRMAMSVVQQNPKLLDCSSQSVLGCIMTAAQLGLYPDNSVLGHAYFVPFKGVCTFIAGYKGLINLASRSDRVTSIMGYAVYEGDAFEFEYGLSPTLKHKPSGEPIEGREITHVYAMARMLNEPIPQFVVMTKEECDKIRSRSPAGQRGPWVTDYEPMAIKTSIRRLCKYLPLSSELQRAIALDEHADVGLDQGLEAVGQEVLDGLGDPEDVIDTTAETVDDDDKGGLDDLAENMPKDEPNEYEALWLKGNEKLGDEEWKTILAGIREAIGVSQKKKYLEMTAKEQKALIKEMTKVIG
jgi:recombination protein RecT